MLNVSGRRTGVARSTHHHHHTFASATGTTSRTTTIGRRAFGSALRLSRTLVYGLLGAALLLGAADGVVARPLYHPKEVGAFGIVENRGCATTVSEYERGEMEAGLVEARSALWDGIDDDLEAREAQATPGKVLKEVVFDIYFHVVYANETYEGGYVPDDQIQEQIAVLNRDYKSTNISYNLVNVTRIENSDWFTNVWPGSPQEAEMKATYHKGNSSVLNIFTAGFNATDRSLGYASLPSSYLREPLKDGLIIRYSTLPGGSHKNYNLGRTMVHELGHWLGLYHTFEGGCTGVGDNVADTAPESSGAEGCPVGRKSCPKSKDPDPIHNFMDYSFDSCMTHFTPGQAVRMHEAIWAFRTQRPPVANTTAAVASSVTATSTTPSAPTTSTLPPQSESESEEQESGEEVNDDAVGPGAGSAEQGEGSDDEAPPSE